MKECQLEEGMKSKHCVIEGFNNQRKRGNDNAAREVGGGGGFACQILTMLCRSYTFLLLILQQIFTKGSNLYIGHRAISERIEG